MSDERSGSESGNGPVGRSDSHQTPDPALGGLLSRLAQSTGSEGVELGGENVRFEQAPEDGVEIRITLLDDEGHPTSVASVLRPADEPFPAHPDDVPFVRNAPLRVIEDHLRGVLLAIWMLGDEDGPDPKAALAAVVRGSREAGWRIEVRDGDTRSRPADSPGPIADPVHLVRGDQVRRVDAWRWPGGPVVSLTQKRDVADV